jgi:hypothetical protein
MSIVRQFAQPVLAVVDLDDILLGSRAGRRIGANAIQRNGAEMSDQINRRPHPNGELFSDGHGYAHKMKANKSFHANIAVPAWKGKRFLMPPKNGRWV